ncbi:uncharacterized protein LOC122538036 isoform X1 [Frieseomelitta varia]|uniref:uncharacterized protein LOC122538036 isoform X1 n=1 Tax=Frieseomelitta varia TaxID=561572 RepID=UPI001CB68BB6|nr:uncharacterized protein LOC122538036 isoform X1 [Frieseomelitta varia]
MKYRNKNQCCERKSNKSINPLINRRQPDPLQYVFYAILNTDLHMNQGIAAANIATGLMFLYDKLKTNNVKCQYIDYWKRNGQRIIILKGYDHKHLKYLQEEIKFLALGTYVVRHKWSRNSTIKVLVVFGQKEHLQEVFEGLSYLR